MPKTKNTKFNRFNLKETRQAVEKSGLNLKTKLMNLITNETSRPMTPKEKSMEIVCLEEENKLLKGNLQLHRLYSIVLMCIVVFLCIGLFVVTYNAEL